MRPDRAKDLWNSVISPSIFHELHVPDFASQFSFLLENRKIKIPSNFWFLGAAGYNKDFNFVKLAIKLSYKIKST